MKPHEKPPYPMDGALFVPVHGLNIPVEPFRWRGEADITNHHYAHPRRALGRLAILQVFRDMDPNQERLPRLGHDWIHEHFGPPILPPLSLIMGRLALALDNGEKLRYGTAHDYHLEVMNEQIWQACQDEYNQIHQIDRVEV